MYYNGDLKVSGFKRNFCTMIYIICSCPFDVRVVNNIKDIFPKIDLSCADKRIGVYDAIDTHV